MPAGLGFIVQAILGMMGSQSLLHVGALSVRLSEGFLVLMAVCSVRSGCVLYLVVVSMVVLSQTILCPVVREWWAGADWLWEKSSGLCKHHVKRKLLIMTLNLLTKNKMQVESCLTKN